MRTIKMDASKWRSKEDFYEALAVALGSFDGHGRNADAFQETMIYYLHLNGVQPPYEIIVRDSDEILRPFLQEFSTWIQEARADPRCDPEWGDDIDVKVVVL